MTQARLMDGTALARRIVEDTARRAAELTARTGVVPCLATVLVGEDPASVTYVRMKQNRCRKAGITSRHVALPASTSTAELVGTLRELSADPAVHGILLQHPVGDHVDERAAFEAIAPEKDVDGVTFASFATMSFGLPGFVSCTPGGILRLLDEYGVDPAGKRAVVVGRSAILGKPVGMLLLARDATVTYCHSRTADLPAAVREADIVVAAVGRPRLLRGQDIKPGAVVVDAGYNAGNVGDVDFDSAVERASLITPVPGGVGPMTIATLLEQTVTAAETAAGGLGAA
ncbi:MULTISPECIES: bifunctional 5,10-methylenetetrahydrofolate dehydrogenase/5,10-methenyltetrahydrofolate cyclohydrolase [unclassified Streptomyces]|uniref:bifunctional 5,10-methylenetetrahydrofolate dehydrogenase/5,10-methenyltetrahydrofolate cyclohydrolase n=1 Tax=unclassified Streptomyces TaxID=2593676 RepID=UPI0013173D52|nr:MULTISPECIES: bifunctional 5,10-methylenetetrahydrofolate dehydrogenase/5,10-methenyltetrahydrofolate cyclohydrolase [unclassified Streptomyces]QHC32854.1 bifunctional 5,10-methylene-tetrahydrofolate dehydrogenase/5,10-methylene-tetrahydrofolate cyclohydrolase [Streptomyces sp. HF10]WKE73333.1 bifunctional 5,10-methylenetetrahydrofolate dehydrogenase/5,10-methenyltetrahydrofolate cyclohydrolase [Streptomyces sp. WP-1]